MQDIHIKRGDLHLAISRAINLGRVKVTLDGSGALVWASVDLAERDDDLLGAELPTMDELLAGDIGKGRPFPADSPIREDIGEWKPFTVGPEVFTTDDHGAAIPAQMSRIETPHGAVEGFITDAKGNRLRLTVYEFALEDAVYLQRGFGLNEVALGHAPDAAAADAADWVHVFDRVTRERRTLKRPTDDKVLTGLRDVAADLRGWAPGDWARCVVPKGQQRAGDLVRVTCVDKAGGFLGFTGDGATQDMGHFERYEGALSGG